MKNVLFVCSRNRLRSPTAERVFADHEGIETASAGLSPDAENPLTPEMVRWADLIFVMERSHRTRLQKRFRPSLHGKRVICLEIADDYDAMQPELVELLRAKVTRFLPAGGGRPKVPAEGTES